MNDILNAIFEFGGSIVIWMNVIKLNKDKKVMGVFWPIWGFYAAWGLWNLHYYPSLNQWWSFYAGIFLVIGNLFWVGQAWYYSIKNKEVKSV
jgi:hypothetical protein